MFNSEKTISAKKWFRKTIKLALTPAYYLLNIVYYPILKSYFSNKIDQIPKTTQLFFVARYDLGDCLLNLHYANCWHQARGPACLVLMTPFTSGLLQLAKCVCPNVQIISFENFLSKLVFFIFKSGLIQHMTFNRLFSYASSRWPGALYISSPLFNPRIENPFEYIATFDSSLQKENRLFDPAFLKAYLKATEISGFRQSVYNDFIQLQYKRSAKSRSQRAFVERTLLFKTLKIKTPYVVMNMNCKRYDFITQNRRVIKHMHRLDNLIDYVISKGYDVVIQGRNEQPSLKPRSGLVEYFKSSEISPENDFRLFANCEFAILNKTGPEVFAAICNVPLLGLNLTDISNMTPNGKSRFYPKHVWDSKKEKWIHWKDLLKRPCFFDAGSYFFEEGIEYVDMEEEELIAATEEFLTMLPLGGPWIQYTPLQEEFRSALHPIHLDLYTIVDVPLDAYLTSSKLRLSGHT